MWYLGWRKKKRNLRRSAKRIVETALLGSARDGPPNTDHGLLRCAFLERVSTTNLETFTHSTCSNANELISVLPRDAKSHHRQDEQSVRSPFFQFSRRY